MMPTSPAPAPQKPKAAHKHKEDRVILHFDYDCFYASVFENENPALRSLPLGVKQKTILATCNYVARARGVRKLMLISDAQQLCPDLVLVNGEDLTRFRDVSKRLWACLRSHSWNNKVERLGLDEVFLDVTDMVEYNHRLLNPNALGTSFFQLSKQEPELGFHFDAASIFGCFCPQAVSSDGAPDSENPLYVRLLLASHLAGYLRHKLEDEFGYTSTCGVSTNKVLAKLAGTVNKPKNQTTLFTFRDDAVQTFLDPIAIRKIPGMGHKASHLIQQHVLSQTADAVPHDETRSAMVTTRQVLAHTGMSPELLEKILGGPGTERGIGQKTWNLLHGVDNTPVKEASDVPTQISIEDTYVFRPLNSQADVSRELHSLSTALIRRMRNDLLDDDVHADGAGAKRWVAYPKTLRLSTRVKSSKDGYHNRTSRSTPLPNFCFSLKDDAEHTSERLVAEALLPLFRRLHSERQGWNLALLNICATNLVMSGKDEGGAGVGGRDISVMFRKQDARLREFVVHDSSPPPSALLHGASGNATSVDATCQLADDESALSQDSDDLDGMVWKEAEGGQACSVCGHTIPPFAFMAHDRFHALGD